ncbi:MAG: sugar ABC transporter permease [Microbacterium sp.]
MTSPPLRKTTVRRSLSSDARWAVLFIAPMLLGLAVFYLWPAVGTLFTSFTKTGPFGGWTWIGLDNYRQVFESDQVGRALLNTVVYSGIVLVSVPLALVIAALMAARGLRAVWLFRLAYFLPVITLPVAIGWIWRLLYNGDFGPLNTLLAAVGLPSRSWLAEGDTALIAISIVGIWMSIGYPIVLFTAALQNVPEELHEAAALDGAGPIRRFVNVTVPMVSPTIFFVVVLTLIGTLQMFDLIFVMIGDRSPVRYETQTIIYLFYKSAFIDNQRGLGSAIVVCLMVIIMALTYVQFRLQKKWVHYE